MVRYLLRRLLLMIPVLLGVSLLTFAIAKFAPGDPIRMMLGQYATAENMATLRLKYGLDDPVFVQFVKYLRNALQGDLGLTIRGQKPVVDEILLRLPATLTLAVGATLFASVVGIATGILAATARRRWVAALANGSALFGLSIPGFWLAIVCVLIFGVQLRWVSVTGGSGWRNLVLPIIVLGIAPAAILTRLTRSSVLEVYRENYVTTARAKGVGESVVITRHVLRNALIPVVTMLGLQFAGMLGGAIFIEAVFARPGLGKLAIDAVAQRDYPLVQGIVLFTALVYVVMNLLVDLLYATLDPRIRYE
jgi:peptide/nickel transport system permease protein